MSNEPQSIGRYLVLRLLGEGGMGAVYLCQDPLLKRQVAVKTVLEGKTNSTDMLSRFQRESEISARLNHPNIITVFDVGDDPALGPFMTMEFIDGASLSSLIHSGPLPHRTAIELLAQGARALGAAAKAGVIHRDVKPENILVSQDWILKLTDFGVAREETSTNLTTTGMLVGTPTHTAPELLAGDKASPATDRYAFAVTAFQLMTGGDLPHKGTTLHALMSHIVNAEPEMPEGMSAPAVRAFLKALHKDPTRRFETTQAFLEALAEAYGVPEAMPSKPLDRTPTPMPGEMVTQDMPTPASFESRTSGSTPKERSKFKSGGSSTQLKGPPSDLFKHGEGGDDIPAPSELAKQIRLGLAQPSPQANAGRVHLPPMPTVPTRSYTGILTLVVLVAGGLVGWNYLQSKRAKEALAVPAAADPIGPLPGFATLITDPPGAKVVIGGRELSGLTPMDTLVVPSTDKDILITKKGYRTWRGHFGPNAPLPNSIHLEPGG